MSMSNGGNSGEQIPRYISPIPVNSTIPDRRRRGKNIGGHYYANTGSRGDANGGRYPNGGSGYQRNHRGVGGGSGDGPHNGAPGYHHGRDYDGQLQPNSQSPTESHSSSRSGSHQHYQGQGSMNHSNGQQHHHYQQHGHHQYQKQEYDTVGGRQHEYRSHRGNGGGDGQHHGQHHHHHNNNHYSNHHHHRNNLPPPPPQQPHSENCQVVSGHAPQVSHGSGYGGTGNGSATNHPPIVSGPAPSTEIAVIPPPSQEQTPYSATGNNGNGGNHYQQQPVATNTAVISQFPPGLTPTVPPGPPATLGFYGYHPNSQPMFGSLALCHIPYGVNPSSVISPVVYTQIIGSGMLTPGLPYNLTCGIPTPFLQPTTATAAPLIFQPPQQQQPQQFSPFPPPFHAHPGPYAVGGHQMINSVGMAGGMSHQQSSQNQHHSHQHHQSGGSGGAGGDDCGLFDSSGCLLNPDADAFFPPTFPPVDGTDNAEEVIISGDMEREVGVEEEPIVVVDDDDDEDIDPVNDKLNQGGNSSIDESGLGIPISPESDGVGEDEDNEEDVRVLEEASQKSNACESGDSKAVDSSGDGNESV